MQCLFSVPWCHCQFDNVFKKHQNFPSVITLRNTVTNTKWEEPYETPILKGISTNASFSGKSLSNGLRAVCLVCECVIKLSDLVYLMSNF